MSKRDPKVRLLHMRDYAQKAVTMVEGQTRDDLNIDEKLRLALTHLVELEGAAVSTQSHRRRRRTRNKTRYILGILRFPRSQQLCQAMDRCKRGTSH